MSNQFGMLFAVMAIFIFLILVGMCIVIPHGFKKAILPHIASLIFGECFLIALAYCWIHFGSDIALYELCVIPILIGGFFICSIFDSCIK